MSYLIYTVYYFIFRLFVYQYISRTEDAFSPTTAHIFSLTEPSIPDWHPSSRNKTAWTWTHAWYLHFTPQCLLLAKVYVFFWWALCRRTYLICTAQSSLVLLAIIFLCPVNDILTLLVAEDMTTKTMDQCQLPEVGPHFCEPRCYLSCRSALNSVWCTPENGLKCYNSCFWTSFL